MLTNKYDTFNEYIILGLSRISINLMLTNKL